MSPTRWAEPTELELRAPSPEPHEPALHGVVDSVRRHKLILASCIVLCGALGVAYTLYSVPVYEASAMVRFEAERVDLPQLVQLPYTDNLISTEMEVLRGRSAAVAVIDSLGLRARLIRRAMARSPTCSRRCACRRPPTAGRWSFARSGNGDFVVSHPDSAEGARHRAHRRHGAISPACSWRSRPCEVGAAGAARCTSTRSTAP